MHPWNVSVQEAAKIQLEMRGYLSLEDEFTGPKLVAGIDVGIPAGTNTGHAVVVVLSFPDFEIVEVQHGVRELEFPYIPGFLTFREAPVVLSALEKVKNIPDIIIVDGQGIAHPRRLGLAAHLGVLLDHATIGCAKSLLYGTCEEPDNERGSVTTIVDSSGEQIGNVVRTRRSTRPVYISPGNKVSFDSAVRVVLDCAPKYRLPEPTRIAHRLAGEMPHSI